MFNVFSSHNPERLLIQQIKETKLQLLEFSKQREYMTAMETMLKDRLSRLIKVSQGNGVDNV